MAPGELLSIAILMALAAVMMVGALWAHRRTHYTLGQSFLYLVNAFFTRLLWRTTISGPLPVKPGQGAVIVSNHRSGIDPLLIQLATDRVVHWMVAREYIEHPVMAWGFRILQSIPVNRAGVDTASTKQAIRLARSGALVGNFPEGRINQTDDVLLPGRPGAALIAVRAQVPVVACFIAGSPYDGSALGPLLMPARAHVTVGPLIDISRYYGRTDKASLEELTKLLLKEIARLAGDEDFEPQLAGKRWSPEQLQEA